MLKKPVGAFGAMLGNSSSKRKLGPVKVIFSPELIKGCLLRTGYL